MNPSTKTIAFVGLGTMGWPMAACLVKAGFRVRVVDASPGKADRFEKEVGGKAFDSAKAATAAVDTLILMLPTSGEVRHVIDEVVNDLRPGTLIIDMTSGSPDVTKAIASELEPRGMEVIDAPVSGGAARAATGELAIMIGATDEALAHANPMLKVMGNALHHVGLVGAGQTVKALNNLVFSSGLLIACEALLIGQRAGVDPAKIVDVLNSGTGGNGATRVLAKNQILNRAFKPMFRMDLMFKDLTIAADLARATKTTAPYSLMCRETWSAALSLLGPGLDNAAIAQYCEKVTGEILSSPTLSK